MKKLHVLYLSVALVIVTAFITSVITREVTEYRCLPNIDLAEAGFRLLKVEEQCGIEVDKYRCASVVSDMKIKYEHRTPWAFLSNVEQDAIELEKQGRFTGNNKALLFAYKQWLITAFKEDFERYIKEGLTDTTHTIFKRIEKP